MEDKQLVKMFNPTLKRRETILFFLIVVINGLIWIVSDIGLDTCARGRWWVEVSKMEMNQPLGKHTFMMHSDLSLLENLSLTKKINIKMSGGLLEHFNIK